MEDRLDVSYEKFSQMRDKINELTEQVCYLKNQNHNLTEYNNLLISCNSEQVKLLNKLMK